MGLDPIVLCEAGTGKIYENVKIDSEESVQNLQTGAGKALGFAQKVVYFCKETIGYLLAKANSHRLALDKLNPEEKPAENAEENKENAQTEENKSEESGGQ